MVDTDTLTEILTNVLRRGWSPLPRCTRLAAVADVATPPGRLPHPAASYITSKIIELDGGAEAPVFPRDAPNLLSTIKQ